MVQVDRNTIIHLTSLKYLKTPKLLQDSRTQHKPKTTRVTTTGRKELSRTLIAHDHQESSPTPRDQTITPLQELTLQTHSFQPSPANEQQFTKLKTHPHPQRKTFTHTQTTTEKPQRTENRSQRRSTSI